MSASAVSTGEIRKMTAESLRDLLRSPLARLQISTPTIETCQEFVIWVWSGPIGPIKRQVLLSAKPSRHLTALRNALPEAESYWQWVMDGLGGGDPTQGQLTDMKAHYAKEIIEPLGRLKRALDECESLLQKAPSDFKESWENAAVSLATVFGWAVSRSGSNARSGLSKGGPSFTFVYEGLRFLGWVIGSSPTEDAVLQFLKRHRKMNSADEDNSF